MRRLPHRSFGLFRGWTGSCQARGQEEPAGRAQARPGKSHSPRRTGSASNLAWRCRCSSAGSRFLFVDAFFVYTVLDVGSMIAIDCGAMQMGIVGSGAVCYQCMRALLSLWPLFFLSPEFLRPFRVNKRAKPGCLHFLAFFHAPSLVRSRLSRRASESRHILF